MIVIIGSYWLLITVHYPLIIAKKLGTVFLSSFINVIDFVRRRWRIKPRPFRFSIWIHIRGYNFLDTQVYTTGICFHRGCQILSFAILALVAC